MINRQGQSGPITSEDQTIEIDFAACAAATAADQPFAVPGALVGDTVTVTPLGTWPENISLPQGRCLEEGEVTFRIVNPTAGAINPGSQLVRIHLEHF